MLEWASHLSPISGSRDFCPIFFQFVTDVIMEELVKRYFPVPVGTVGHECEVTLDYEEHNAIRYTAGYVVRALAKKIDHSNHPHKRELGLCLAELEEESNDGDHPSEDWLKAVDRGGLKHVSDITYMLFTAMERALRVQLGNKDASALSGIKESSTAICSDEDVLFYWSMLSVNWGEETAQVLLCKIVEHWVTLRGFSHASAFIEKYKQSSKKNIQKSKGVRKRLQTE